jgi:hypothetical protein
MLDVLSPMLRDSRVTRSVARETSIDVISGAPARQLLVLSH